MSLTAVRIHDTHAHFRIWISGVRIFLAINGWVVRNEIRDRILRNLHLVHLHVYDVLSIRRPKIIAADVEFLLIHPVHFAIEHVVSVVLIRGRQLVLARVTR